MRTNGITAQSAPGNFTSVGVPAGGNKRKSTTGYHTPFAPDGTQKSRRVSERIEEESASAQDVDINTSAAPENASAWGDESVTSNGYTGSNRKIAWSTTDLLKAPSGDTVNEVGKAKENAKAPAKEESKEDITMCVLDSNVLGNVDKFLNLCVILDLPEKAQGVTIEAVDVQCALGPLTFTIGRNELCVLLSPANTTLCRRVSVALQGVLNLSGVLQENQFLLRDFSNEVLPYQHIPCVLLGSGACYIDNFYSSQTRRLKGHNNTIPEDNFDAYFAFLRSRDRNLGTNADVLRHINYAKYYSLISQALPNTLSIFLRTSEVNATLFSAAMVRSFVTNMVDLVSCSAIDGYIKSTISTGREYAKRNGNDM